MAKGHTIKFSDFMDGSYKEKKVRTSNKLYSFHFSPFMLIDPTICVIGGAFIGLVILEKQLEKRGHYGVLEHLELFINIAIPTVAMGVIMYLLSQVSGVFL